MAKTTEALRIISRHRCTFDQPPTSTPANHSIDAPLLGNGDLGVAISGTAWSQRYWISKNDFWKLRKGRRFGGGPAPIGGLDLNIRDLFRVGTYHLEQDLYSAETEGTFVSPARTVRVRSWVVATQNTLVVEISCDGEKTMIEPELWIAGGRGSESACYPEDKVAWGYRRFFHECEIETGAALALREVPTSGTSPRNLGTLTVSPGETVILAVTACTNFESADYVEESKRTSALLGNSNRTDVEKLRRAHREWWARFWGESHVSIDDTVIEKQYYLSQYILASASRNPEFPPPIFGNWITTDDPAWMGDYHLNYNHMAPYYGLYSSNHIEQAAPYDAPILDFFGRGTYYADKLLGVRGVYLPVGIGPKGVETTWDSSAVDGLIPNYEEDGLFFGQKSNAAYAVVNMSMRWFATYDHDYGTLVYPYVKAVAEFWEDYLTWDGKRFVSESDSIHEGSGTDFNPILSLGLIRCVMRTAIDLSDELGVDQDRHATWRHILANMSDFPTCERNGRQVFRLTERGVDWWENNTLGIQHIYPSGTIGPGDDLELLRISRDTIAEMDRWFDTNGMNSLYPAAVRVGYDPEVILARLHEHCEEHLHPNGFTRGNPHGIETCSTVPNTINEMLCMSYRGIIRVFFNWPKSRDASFSRLRAHGAFLVSSLLEGGEVAHVSVHSEKGRVCRIANPWPGKAVHIEPDDPDCLSETLDGDVLDISTDPGETFMLTRSDQ
jgi:alpha-L-fucosidase 2